VLSWAEALARLFLFAMAVPEVECDGPFLLACWIHANFPCIDGVVASDLVESLRGYTEVLVDFWLTTISCR